jgi:hypothetical protein
LIVDLVEHDVVYSIRKSINNPHRQKRTADFIHNAESDRCAPSSSPQTVRSHSRRSTP